jgi:hypothetical protein
MEVDGRILPGPVIKRVDQTNGLAEAKGQPQHDALADPPDNRIDTGVGGRFPEPFRSVRHVIVNLPAVVKMA